MSLAAKRPKLVVVLGPTASGKTETAVEIAARTGAVIVSADSLQVYRRFDIGSAKPAPAQTRGIPHFLIDVVDPDQEFNAGIYMRLALSRIGELLADRRKIVVVGGTFLYVRALLCGLVERVGTDREFRDRLARERDELGTAALYRRLLSVDPGAAGRIDPNDYVRIERALEAHHLTGRGMSYHQSRHGFSDERFDVLKIGLSTERERLRSAIDSRVDRMIDRGLVEEVRGIRAAGYGADLKPMKSIGYRQMNDFIDRKLGFAEAVEIMKRDTGRFSKRQLTWLRSEEGIRWFDPARRKDSMVAACREFWD